MNTSIPQRDLVLLGGGHSHALVLRQFAMQGLPHDVRVTLVSDASHSPYSGMLPGLIAGHYSFSDTHIDLRSFCAAIGVRFICARALGINTQAGNIVLAGRPPLEYDLLSINTGASPELDTVPGARDFAVPVKPVADFYERWCSLEQRIAEAPSGKTFRIVVVGGGAGSVELVLAMQHKLSHRKVALALVCGGALLETYNPLVRRTVRARLQRLGIELHEANRVSAVQQSTVQLASGAQLDHDALVWCTAVIAPQWLRDSGLPCNEQGFLRIQNSLQVEGYENLFAAGDVATQTASPRPKAGVYAVRQAPFLAENLRAALLGRPLRSYQPQRRFLSLLSLGNRKAVADRGFFAASGGWVWRWKDSIDRRFMRQFSQAPIVMPGRAEVVELPMHCGGCGAKLPAALLREVLADMACHFPSVVDANQFGDDAAVLESSPGKVLLQSVDSLRQLIDDPWVMGRIAALHALSDLYAMGAQPRSCLAHISLPYGGASIQRRDLSLLMGGALTEMDRAGCRLLGGHSLEGPELSMGFTVNGEAVPTQLLAKVAVAKGQQLVLTKPLGTGVLFAAQAQGSAQGHWIDAAINVMLQSNAAAATLALEFGLGAATDVTGFGLAGHLLEMLPGEELQACLSLASIPMIEGTEEALAAGFASTLQPSNIAAAAAELIPDDSPRNQILFDPQTSGGLLFAVPVADVEDFLRALRAAGYRFAAAIGELRLRAPGGSKLQLRA